MNLQRVNESVKRHGLVNTVSDLVLKGVNRRIVFRILKGVKIEQVNPAYLACDQKYEGRFLDRADLAAFADRSEFDLSADFLERAFAKGDECYGFLAGGMLAAYGWYSRQPTAIDLPSLVLHFNRQYVYMYKGFTHPEHRGQRLHAVGMSRALQAYLAQGFRGIVSYVEKTNFDSLRSCYRMGYQDFGSLYVAGLPNHYLLHASRGCRAMDFRLKFAAAPSSVPSARPQAATTARGSSDAHLEAFASAAAVSGRQISAGHGFPSTQSKI